MNMQSTTLISTNYALNFALWLYQALLNCEIHRLMKKLVTDTLHVAIFGALVTGQTASPYFFHNNNNYYCYNRLRKKEPPGESGWVWVGAVWK